ncbi:MAG: single-stranded DNA-binding protein [Bacteroidia bacterium]|nr:single-stranded DNA-binding protein [Bacteroidia bacterium]MCX7651332.1 single-stranded DNA-binding protein [Bacteroidia bacterium]MDW8417148.1 single-stranded DNA-binding protein [Bacteroidia bacterium]
MYLKLIAVGRLGRDAELRSVSNGQVIRFSIPSTQRLPSGEEKTQWIECSYWRNPGESTEVLKLLKKGAIVLVEGTPGVRLYTRQDNTPGISFECRVQNLRIVSYASQDAQTPTATDSSAPDISEPTPPDLSLDDNDLPF